MKLSVKLRMGHPDWSNQSLPHSWWDKMKNNTGPSRCWAHLAAQLKPKLIWWSRAPTVRTWSQDCQKLTDQRILWSQWKSYRSRLEAIRALKSIHRIDSTLVCLLNFDFIFPIVNEYTHLNTEWSPHQNTRFHHRCLIVKLWLFYMNRFWAYTGTSKFTWMPSSPVLKSSKNRQILKSHCGTVIHSKAPRNSTSVTARHHQL